MNSCNEKRRHIGGHILRPDIGQGIIEFRAIVYHEDARTLIRTTAMEAVRRKNNLH